jgi:hypothetical protein
MDNSLELARILQANFNIKLPDGDLESDSAYFKYLQLALAERIKYFIRTDIDKLLQALYRIDINDKLSDEAFNLGEINKVSEKLAELIILRQLKKLEYSKNYDRSSK